MVGASCSGSLKAARDDENGGINFRSLAPLPTSTSNAHPQGNGSFVRGRPALEGVERTRPAQDVMELDEAALTGRLVQAGKRPNDSGRCSEVDAEGGLVVVLHLAGLLKVVCDRAEPPSGEFAQTTAPARRQLFDQQSRKQEAHTVGFPVEGGLRSDTPSAGRMRGPGFRVAQERTRN